MKIKHFNYTKKDGEKTERKALVLVEKDDYFDTIDLGHLDESEVDQVKQIQKEYEDKLVPFMKKAFRRFSKNGIDLIEEEKL